VKQNSFEYPLNITNLEVGDLIQTGPANSLAYGVVCKIEYNKIRIYWFVFDRNITGAYETINQRYVASNPNIFRKLS
jgi:hypothetical protein